MQLKIFLLAFVLSLFTSLQAQDLPQNKVLATGAYIEVSDSLYQTIKDWLLFGNASHTLDQFLLTRYYDEREALDFLGAYYSGRVGDGGNLNKSTANEPCICNVIRAATVDFHKSPYKYDKKQIPLPDFTKTYTVEGDGMYKAIDQRLDGSDDGEDTREISGFIKVEIINLCTYLGALQSECNCNKPIQ